MEVKGFVLVLAGHLHEKKRAKRSQEPLAGKVTVESLQHNAGKSSLAASLSLPLHVSCS